MRNDAEGTVFESVLLCNWLERASLYRVVKNWLKLKWWKLRGAHVGGHGFDIHLDRNSGSYFLLARNAGIVRQYDNQQH